MHNKNVIYEFTRSFQKRFGEVLHSIVIFGSFPRDEAKDNSDLDLICVFTQIDQETLKKIGTFCREFSRQYSIDADPVCITIDEYLNKGFHRWYGDPIKYFEAKVVYGQLEFAKPSRSEVIKQFEDLIVELTLHLRHCYKSGISKEKLASGILRNHILKPLIVALKLERFLVSGHYPFTIKELHGSCDGHSQQMAVNWYRNPEQFTQDLLEKTEDVLQYFWDVIHDISNKVASLKNLSI